MTDKIKEILEEVKFELKFEKWIEPLGFDKEHWKLLLDYITNLQQENEDLKNRLENAVADCNLRLQENEQLNNIIEKYEQPLKFLKNRIKQGMSIEEQHKNFIWYVESRLQELKESGNNE